MRKILLSLTGLIVMVLLLIVAIPASDYNWSEGNFNGAFEFDYVDDCDKLINNLSSYYSKIYKLDNQLYNWITNNGEKI